MISPEPTCSKPENHHTERTSETALRKVRTSDVVREETFCRCPIKTRNGSSGQRTALRVVQQEAETCAHRRQPIHSPHADRLRQHVHRQRDPHRWDRRMEYEIETELGQKP